MKHLITALAAAAVFFIIVNHLDASSDASMRIAGLISITISLYHLAMVYVDTHK